MGLKVGRYVLTKNNIKKLAGTGGSTPVPVDKNFIDLFDTSLATITRMIGTNSASISVTFTNKGKEEYAKLSGLYNTEVPVINSSPMGVNITKIPMLVRVDDIYGFTGNTIRELTFAVSENGTMTVGIYSVIAKSITEWNAEAQKSITTGLLIEMKLIK